ncbi:MAG: cysteine desulfurase family protein [Chthoniobacterales bacterium]
MIYLDYNATTPLSTPAWEAMRPYLERHFGNPSSVHRAGREARAAIDNARDALAALLRIRPNELIFTSGGTEANNLALLGLARNRASHGKHLISNRAEHHAVLNTLEHLEAQEGFEVTWLQVSGAGLIDPAALAEAIRPDTTLVSIMTANNETGVIQPMAEISAVCRERGVLFHSDMVQSFGKQRGETGSPPAVIPSEAEGFRGASRKPFVDGSESVPENRRDPSTPLRFAQDNLLVELVDAASFAAHKFYGPKGAGFLYLRAGLPIDQIQFGGAHEAQRRPGTENVAAIAGMAAAAELVRQNPPDESELRDQLWAGISATFPAAQRNGVGAPRLANTLNVSFPGYSSETLLMALDLEGICASSGSACMVGSVVASHVLLAMGLPMERAASAVRFSLGKATTEAEINETIAALARIFTRFALRKSGATPPQHALV